MNPIDFWAIRHYRKILWIFYFELKCSILIKWKLHDLLSWFHLFLLSFFFNILNNIIFIVVAILSTVVYSYFTHCYQLTEKEIVYLLTICGNAICNRFLLYYYCYETEDFLCSYVRCGSSVLHKCASILFTILIQ